MLGHLNPGQKNIGSFSWIPLGMEVQRGRGVMAVDCNKFSFVIPGHIFRWNLMRLGMGPLFDMLYP